MSKTENRKSKTASQEVKDQKQEISPEETDISERVIDDGYFDVSEDKKIAIYLVGVQRTLEKAFGKKKITAAQLLKKIPEISNLCDIEVHEFTKVPSASITPQMMLDLSIKIQEKLNKEDLSGAVIIHGADTLEETAYFLGISLSEKFQTNFYKPIVFTTANDLPNELEQNLISAIRVACHDFRESAPQVLVCVNGEIHSTKKVQKVRTSGAATFKSPGWGPVGHVDHDAVYVRPGSTLEDVGLNFPTPKKLTAKVGLVKATTGDKGELVDQWVASGAKGIVIEGFGGGNLPETMLGSIRNAIKKGIIIVVATRCEEGRVIDDEEFAGSVADLIQEGALTAGETEAAKARLLLSYVLSQPDAAKLMEQNLQLYKALLLECLDPVLADRLFEI